MMRASRRSKCNNYLRFLFDRPRRVSASRCHTMCRERPQPASIRSRRMCASFPTTARQKDLAVGRTSVRSWAETSARWHSGAGWRAFAGLRVWILAKPAGRWCRPAGDRCRPRFSKINPSLWLRSLSKLSITCTTGRKSAGVLSRIKAREFIRMWNHCQFAWNSVGNAASAGCFGSHRRPSVPGG